MASVVIETPQSGAFTPIHNCEFDLAYSPLLLWRDGRGEVVFSQIDATNRIGLDPATGILPHNLARYLDVMSATDPNEQVLMAEGDGAAASLPVEQWASNPDPAGDLLPEPGAGPVPELLYSQPLQEEDEPCGFTPW